MSHITFLRKLTDILETEAEAFFPTEFEVKKIPSEYRLCLYVIEVEPRYRMELAIEVKLQEKKWKVFSTDPRFDLLADKIVDAMKLANVERVEAFYA